MPDGVPFRLTAFDGSTAGARDADIRITLASERGLSYLLTAPGDLGMARAYVSGDLQIDGSHPGDPYDVMRVLMGRMRLQVKSPAEVLRLVRGLGWEHLKPPP